MGEGGGWLTALDAGVIQTGLLPTATPLLSLSLSLSHQSYQWLKEKIVSEDGKKQQAKLKELNRITEQLGCTLPQLAVGKASTTALGAPPSSPKVDSVDLKHATARVVDALLRSNQTVLIIP